MLSLKYLLKTRVKHVGVEAGIQQNNFKPVEADDTSELSASEQLADLSE